MPTPSTGGSDDPLVTDADALVSLEDGDDAGRNVLATLTDSDPLAVPDPVWDEVRWEEYANDPWRLESPGGGKAMWGSHLADDGHITADGPDDACRAAWSAGQAAVVRGVAVERLPEDIVADLRENHPERFDDGTFDLTSAGRPESPYEEDPTLAVDVDEADLSKEEERLGRGESAAILTAHAVDGAVLSNDANARAVAADEGVEETDLLHAVGAAVSEGRLRERLADAFVRNWYRHGDFLEPRLDAHQRADKLTAGDAVAAVHGDETARTYDEDWGMATDRSARDAGTKYSVSAPSGTTESARDTDSTGATPETTDAPDTEPAASTADTKYSVDAPSGLRESASTGEAEADGLVDDLAASLEEESTRGAEDRKPDRR